MNLLEMQKKVLRLIEEINTDGTNEITKDPDIKEKINDVINLVNVELCRIKKLPAVEELDVKENDEITLDEELDSFYQLNVIKNVRYEQIENNIIFLEDGTAKVYYYKFPKKITKETDAEKYKFENTEDVLEALIMGVAADILKNDVSSNYGRIYAERYNELKQSLDPRFARGSVIICNDGLDF